MRKFLTTAMAVALASATTYADLQNVEIGGGIRTRALATFLMIPVVTELLTNSLNSAQTLNLLLTSQMKYQL
jgi:hypothetical protein